MNDWMTLVMKVKRQKGCTLKEAMKVAKSQYKKK